MNSATRRYYKRVNFRSLDQPDCCWNCRNLEMGHEGETDCELMTEINADKWTKFNAREEKIGRDDLPLPQSIISDVGPFNKCDKHERVRP